MGLKQRSNERISGDDRDWPQGEDHTLVMLRSEHDFFTPLSMRIYVTLLLANLHARVVSDYLVFHEAPSTSNSSHVRIPLDRKY